MTKLPVEPFYRIDIRSRAPFGPLEAQIISLVFHKIATGARKGFMKSAGRTFNYQASPDHDGNDADRNIVIVEQ